MQIEVSYRWRIQWAGKWTTTRHHCTEAQIRVEHPEAVCVEWTRRELVLPSSPQERLDTARANCAGGLARGYPGVVVSVQ